MAASNCSNETDHLIIQFQIRTKVFFLYNRNHEFAQTEKKASHPRITNFPIFKEKLKNCKKLATKSSVSHFFSTLKHSFIPHKL